VVKGREKGEREKGGLRDEGARTLDEPFSSFPPIHPSIDNAIRYRRVHRTRNKGCCRFWSGVPTLSSFIHPLWNSVADLETQPILRKTRKIEYRYRGIDDFVDQLITRMMSASLQSNRVINVNCVFLLYVHRIYNYTYYSIFISIFLHLSIVLQNVIILQ